MAVKQLPLSFEFRANQTFDDFYTGCNLEAVSLLQDAVVYRTESQVYIWGGSGLGKSHLLRACCNKAQRVNLSSFYFDLSAEQLPEPDALCGLESFDLVCFDNLEHIMGKPEWELAFFNFFNQHRELGNTLILSASCPPADLKVSLPDLKTRLNWGLTLKLKALDDDDKTAALIFKAGHMGFDISVQTARFILTHYDRDLNYLWALLIDLDHASLAAKRKLTIPFLKEILNQDTSR